jgi:hypothetical protein
VEEAIANYDLAGTEDVGEVDASSGTQVMFENNNDGYHANRLHHGPLHDFVPSNLSSFPELSGDTAGYLRYNGTLHPTSFNATQKAVLPALPG